MKKMRMFAVLALAFAMVACTNKDNDDPMVYLNATVTFRPQADGKYFLKQDEHTALIVKNSNLQSYPFTPGVEQRAIVQYGYDPENPGTNKVEGFDKTLDVTLYALDTVFTKAPVAYDPLKEESYGNDPLGLYLGTDYFPTTMVEDGYLCVCFELPVGMSDTQHSINLLTGIDPKDPYTLELRHNANGDTSITTSVCYMNFPLKDLPDTGGDTINLKLRWNSLVTGETETTTLEYRSRTDW